MHNKLEALKNAATSKAGISALKARKHSPTIMFGVGVVGVVATAVLTARATLRLEETIDDHNASSAILHAAHEVDPERSDLDLKKDLTRNTVNTTITLTKLYAPAVLCGVASIGLLTGSHVTLQRRNAGVTAAYVALAQGFEEYRSRVREDVGPDKEREYRYGKDYKEIYSEGKKGEPIVTQKPIAAGASIYARFFDDRADDWNPTPEYNLITLRAKQNWANFKLNAQGYLFLNDVYDAFGFDRTPAGQVMGWIADANERGTGDGYIDFGVFTDDNMLTVVEYMNGHENAILLDFNVDRGPIYTFI